MLETERQRDDWRDRDIQDYVRDREITGEIEIT